MGAQSDFLSQTFVPSESHKAEQIARAKVLLATGLSIEQIAAMLGLQTSELTAVENLSQCAPAESS